MLGTTDIRVEIITNKGDVFFGYRECVDEVVKDVGMGFAVTKVAGDEHDIKKWRHAQARQDLSGCRGMSQVGQQTQTVSALEGGEHLQSIGYWHSMIEKGREIGLNRHGNAAVIRSNAMAQTLQRCADPEAVVGFLPLSPGVFQKLLHHLTVDREKGVVIYR
jgi:hypothetical protein